MRRKPLSSTVRGSRGCGDTRLCLHEQLNTAAAWADAKNATVAYLELHYLSPGAIYALASGQYTDETVERVLAHV
jgi:hypothetical protein